jgi:hypothetical protein
MRLTRGITAVAALTLAMAVARPAAAQLITNGGFETGLTGWTVLDQVGGSGSWYSQTGTGSPLNGFPVAAPPQGSFAAMTDQGGPGVHVMYQDFVVPVNITSASFSYQQYINNQADDFYLRDKLDYTGNATFHKIQEARTDIITTTADPFSIAPADVLLNLFQTNPGDPLVSGYSVIGADVTAFLQAHAGETLRLRFAEGDNQLFLASGVDDVDFTITTHHVVPEASSVALLLGGALPFGFALRRRRKA